MRLLDEGYPLRRLSKESGILRNQLRDLRKRYLAFGEDGLRRKPAHYASEAEKASVRAENVDFFLIHRANKLIVDRIVKKLKLPLEKVPNDIQEFGNLGGASIPMLMMHILSKELSEKPLTLLCSAFGLELTWATMIQRTNCKKFCQSITSE